MSHVFGPVPSRRLGRSLGVDLVPFKTCTYDCVYCQLGRTTNKTIERKEWVPLGAVVDEVAAKASLDPDYITLSGSGEPTLYSRLDELIAGLHSAARAPVAVLTNGSLLWDATVRRQIAEADLIVPSLDAGDAGLFRAVNRPHPAISFERMLDGLRQFREEYAGEIWLEVFLLAGYSAIESEVQRIAERVKQIRPDRVQVNTVTRPPAENYAKSVEPLRISELAALFEPPAEVVADGRGVHSRESFVATREAVVETLRRRPCSMDDLARGLDVHRNEVLKYIDELLAENRICRQTVAGKTYYKVLGPNQDRSHERNDV